ncbi:MULTISPECIES: DUF6077 domain-containing protein [Actinomadura]|uniref:DUF6077 domain-containing protein n=1 Tax=Actinomadura yumaensis TaxID=111807 RepID=A0ABW2CY71_9ACTN|nr:DUF6077 domain-containing protein [Actinomadura sp. J1-007]MWK39463.1 hypothetical protein [Actinomadura sp. J1-007]
MIGLSGPRTGRAASGRAPWTVRATRALDRACDGAVLSFAAWTVIYDVGLLLRPPTWTMLVAWLAATAAIGALWARGVPSGRLRASAPPRRRALPARAWTAAVGVAVAAGVVAGVCAGLHGDGVPWWCVWLAGLVSVTATAVALLCGRAGEPGGHRPAREAEPGERAEEPGERGEGRPFDDEARGGRWGMPVAAATGLGFAVASLFIVNTDGDDAYFVSRSVATAANGRIPFDDVIFSRGTTGPIAGEPPAASFEVFAGAVARVLGVPAPSFLWYALLPLATFLAVWAMWRLVRAWAPRRPVACFGVGAVYLLWSGMGGASLGSFHLLRMWQGKAVLVSALIPLLYVYFTRWAERRTYGTLALLAAAGVASVGLTSSAAFLIPLVTVAAAAPLVLSGRVRAGLAACVAMAYPLATGATVALMHERTAVVGRVHDAPTGYAWVLLHGVPGVLAGCALWLGPWTARRGVPALVAAGAAGVLTLLFLPGVMGVIHDASNTGQVLWRTLWVAPAPVLIGLLATVRLPSGIVALRPGTAPAVAAAIAPAAVLGIALVAGGTPVWARSNGSTVADRPSWKLPPGSAGTARAVIRVAGPDGTVLMPRSFMRAVPLLSTRVHAVNANDHYLGMLPARGPFVSDRQLLTRAVLGRRSLRPGVEEVREALRRAHVTAACARPRDRAGLRLLQDAGYGDRRRVGALYCVFPPRG